MNASRGRSEMKTAVAYSSWETGRQRDSQGTTGSVRREKQLQYKESRSVEQSSQTADQIWAGNAAVKVLLLWWGSGGKEVRAIKEVAGAKQ